MYVASVRAHLLILVLAVAVPLVAALGFEIAAQRQQAVAHTKSTLRTIAKTMAGHTTEKIALARRTLERVAQRPLVKLVDPHQCDPILLELVAIHPDYANAVYTDMRGDGVCSAVPNPGGKPVTVGENPSFQKFIQERRFNISSPLIGPILKKWVSAFAVPIRNSQNDMVGGVYLPVALSFFDPKLPANTLPQGSRYGFFRDDGTMMWRNLDPEGVIGTRPDAEAARQIVAVRDGEFESLAIDGVMRYFSVVPMPDEGWVAFVGVPVSEVYVAANRRAVTAAALAMLSIGLLVLLALAIARRIADPIAALAETARSIQNGNRDIRAVNHGPREVAQVAQAFNAMTDGLHASALALEGEIAERKLAESQVREMAFHDALTKLPNRLLLNDRLCQALAASARNKVYCALLFLDLDHFKPLNDSHGHAVGDQLLIEVAHRLGKCVRQIDTVARFGGDEFIVVLCDLHAQPVIARAQAVAVAEKIRAQLAAPYLLELAHQQGAESTLVQHQCTASIGVALMVGLHAQPDVLKKADAAMYEAKKSGGDTVRFADLT